MVLIDSDDQLQMKGQDCSMYSLGIFESIILNQVSLTELQHFWFAYLHLLTALFNLSPVP